jgi:rare lipoprotein A (peptidoglycan hydrolase)
MPHRKFNYARALIGTLFLLSLSGDRSVAEPQEPADGSFQGRFQFDQRRGTPPSSQQNDPAPSPRPSPEQKAPTVIEKLIAPPASAEPAPPAAAEPASPPTEAARPERGPPPKARSARPTEPTAKNRSAGRPIGTGRAAWYEHPGRTASGEKYNPDGLTAAHKTLPLGTRLRVVNLRNQRSVDVRINDRSPRKMKFVIDLSRGSARAIGIKDVGAVALYKLN